MAAVAASRGVGGQWWWWQGGRSGVASGWGLFKAAISVSWKQSNPPARRELRIRSFEFISEGEENGLNPGIIVGNVRLCLSHLRFLGFLGSNRVLDRIILWVLLIVIGQRSSLSCSVFLLLLPLLLLLLLPSNHPNELSPSTPYCNRHTLSPHHRRLW